jgi:hypothetical protein
MSSGKDWVPGPDDELDKFFKNYRQVVMKYCTGSDPVWTHIPTARITALTTAYSDWGSAYLKLDGPHTSADVAAKNTQRKKSLKVLRAFNKQYVLDAEEVTDAQRIEIGCPVHDTHPTPVPRPIDWAEASVVLPGPHTVELWIKKLFSLAADPDRPNYGVRIYYGILGDPTAGDRFRLAKPPLSGEELPHSVFTKRRKYRFDFAEVDRCQSVYFCLRYENSKGGDEGEGPWGPIFSAIIP